MFTKIASCAAAALVITAVAAPAHAGEHFNSLTHNGTGWNGLASNGIQPNALASNGISHNGQGWNGTGWNGLNNNGLAANGRSVQPTTFGGEAFVVDGIELPATLR